MTRKERSGHQTQASHNEAITRATTDSLKTDSYPMNSIWYMLTSAKLDRHANMAVRSLNLTTIKI